MAQEHDYSEFRDEKVPDNLLSQIALTALKARELAKEIEADIEATKKKVEEHKRLTEVILVKQMEEAQQKELTTIDGITVTVTEEIRAGIKEENKVKAFAWLNENGHGNLIKRKFEIEFNRDEEAWAAKFQRDLEQRKKPVRVQRKDAVHAQTLGKFCREALEAGLDIPQELLGVFRQNFCKLTVK